MALSLVFTEIHRLEMRSTGSMALHQRVTLLHEQVGNRITCKKNVLTCMQPLTK